MERVVCLFKILHCRYTRERSVSDNDYVFEELLKVGRGPKVTAPHPFVAGTKLIELDGVDLRQ